MRLFSYPTGGDEWRQLRSMRVRRKDREWYGSRPGRPLTRKGDYAYMPAKVATGKLDAMVWHKSALAVPLEEQLT